MRLRLPIAASFALLFTLSCSNPICGCLTMPPSAVVEGRVTAPDGSPVQGARIAVESGDAQCGSAVEIAQGFTRSDGRYGILVMELRSVKPGDCLRAHAAPPAGSALAASDTLRFSVRFTPDAPSDTARVDLVLRTP
jgi:hypothetical protein